MPIHVFYHGDGVAVWIDTEVGEQDGVRIGFGATQQTALKAALEELQTAVQVVEQELRATRQPEHREYM